MIYNCTSEPGLLVDALDTDTCLHEYVRQRTGFNRLVVSPDSTQSTPIKMQREHSGEISHPTLPQMAYNPTALTPSESTNAIL
jgi:hypothetical protein